MSPGAGWSPWCLLSPKERTSLCKDLRAKGFMPKKSENLLKPVKHDLRNSCSPKVCADWPMNNFQVRKEPGKHEFSFFLTLYVSLGSITSHQSCMVKLYVTVVFWLLFLPSPLQVMWSLSEGSFPKDPQFHVIISPTKLSYFQATNMIGVSVISCLNSWSNFINEYFLLYLFAFQLEAHLPQKLN